MSRLSCCTPPPPPHHLARRLLFTGTSHVLASSFRPSAVRCSAHSLFTARAGISTVDTSLDASSRGCSHSLSSNMRNSHTQAHSEEASHNFRFWRNLWRLEKEGDGVSQVHPLRAYLSSLIDGCHLGPAPKPWTRHDRKIATRVPEIAVWGLVTVPQPHITANTKFLYRLGTTSIE